MAYITALHAPSGIIDMPARFKRLIGTLIILVFVLFYALTASLAGDVIVRHQPLWLQLIYFAIAGLLWIFPVGALIRWMYAKPAALK
jgi:hypothetical protein